MNDLNKIWKRKC